MQLAEALRRLWLRRKTLQQAAVADDYRYLYACTEIPWNKRAYLRYMTIALIQHERDLRTVTDLFVD